MVTTTSVSHPNKLVSWCTQDVNDGHSVTSVSYWRISQCTQAKLVLLSLPSGFTVYAQVGGWFVHVRRSSLVSQCGQLAGSDSNDHDDTKYDDHNQVDGKHDLLETMTLHYTVT